VNKITHGIKHYWRRTALTLAAVGMAAGSLVGCGASDSDCQGDPGKVTAKDTDTDSKTTGTGKNRHTSTTTEYELTVLRADGSTYEKSVSSSAYDDWYKVGSRFPSTAHCADGKAKD
jgi:hypothetical protein